MTLVIGFGNPLRGDDGVGPEVARRVAGLRGDVQVLTPLQLLPEMAAAVAGARQVVFIDAAVDGPPGSVACERVIADDGPRVDHALTPATLLALAHGAFGIQPEGWLVRVHGESFDVGAPISAPVAQAISAAVHAVLAVTKRTQQRSGRT